MNIQTLRQMVRNASPGSILLVATDVYAELAHGCNNREQEELGIIGRHSVQIRWAATLKPGAVIMAAAHPKPRTQEGPVNIQTLRQMVREMKAGQTLILAPDVYDVFAAGRVLEEELFGVVGHHSVRIQRSVALKPGTALIMAEAHFDAPQNWAGSFLSKGGPAASRTMELGLVVPVDDLPPEPPPPVSVSRPRERMRIVDT